MWRDEQVICPSLHFLYVEMGSWLRAAIPFQRNEEKVRAIPKNTRSHVVR
jgi:hypothetical protein